VLAGRAAALALAALLAASGCEQRVGNEAASLQRGSPNALRDIDRKLAAGIAHPRHRADGGGRAWLEGGRQGGDLAARVGEPGRFVIVFETGPEGIARGGKIAFQVPP